ncbi:molybdenum storage protein subunit alpha [Pseudonocardia sp. WMMC193]|uniref:amino acid kinase family protein n=1 Tax=Pseudonocardia sp. WMMC193 TaxID=2911965 RepID=UPI001F2B652C|nr:molybdenum storage protein subunit alpha [Pseudonocardia sp. WMMC193]MCF7548751.1 molybdenum storage protein subunit alpha [Pseudonocardia sp. WMMC193]
MSSKDIPSLLARQTLLDRELVRPAAAQPVRRLLPWLDVVVLGGTAIIDRGREAVLPVVDELRARFGDRKMLILTGAGIRARHAMGVGLDLGLPTGALSELAATEAEQNGHLIAALLAEDGVSYVPHGTVARQLAAHLVAGPAVVSNGYPPYGTSEFPPAVGRLPQHRTDAGAVLLADAFGARRLVFVKDGAGPGGRVPASTTGLPVDDLARELLGTAKHVREFRIVDGLSRGALTDALADKDTGTLVHA